LTSRKMRVTVGGCFSTWADITSGVPQWSVLGPLLFLLYVNELPDWIMSSMRMFADDTKIWATIGKVDDSAILQSDLDSLSSWSNKWLLSLNPDKCCVMHMGHGLPTRYYISDGQQRKELKVIEKEKDLSVYSTNDLKPSKQCAVAAAKASSILSLIARHFKQLSVSNFRILYKTYSSAPGILCAGLESIPG